MQIVLFNIPKKLLKNNKNVMNSYIKPALLIFLNISSFNYFLKTRHLYCDTRNQIPPQVPYSSVSQYIGLTFTFLLNLPSIVLHWWSLHFFFETNERL